MPEVNMMRKYLVGFIAGLLLESAFPAYGAVSSLIGKQVQAENSVVVNGTELEVKAVNIDGTTYAPNRAIAKALGLDIDFVDGIVIFEGRESDPPMSDPIETIPENDQNEGLSIEEQIKSIEDKIIEANDEKVLIIGRSGGKPLNEEDQRRIDELNTLMQDYSAEIEALKSQSQ